MARLRAPSLLRAMIRTDISEDRVTEMLAALLDNDAEVRARFVKATARPPAVDHAIATQRIVASGRIDLELRLEHGAAASVVWVEV